MLAPSKRFHEIKALLDAMLDAMAEESGYFSSC